MILSMDDIICIADGFVDFFTDGELNYSVDSLELIEEYLDDLSYFGLEDKALDNASTEIGCYIFETARRCFGGEYKWSEKYEQPILVMGLPEFSVAIMAIDKVKNRLTNGSEDSILFFISGYKEHIEKGKHQKGYNVLII